MNLGAILISSFLVGLSGAMMPGGLLIVNINETIKRGLPGGLWRSPVMLLSSFWLWPAWL